MKDGIPHDYVNKKIIRKHLTRERINIHTDFHNGHPGHSQYLASYIAKTRSRWKRVIYGFQNTPTMVKLRIKCMRHSAISSPVIRFQKLKDAIYHNYIPSRNSPNTTLSKRIGWMKIVTEKDPRNQIIISTETNHKPQWTSQSDDTFRIGTKFHSCPRKFHSTQRNLPYIVSNTSTLTPLNSKWSTYPGTRFALSR